MKKIIALALVLSLLLCACGGGNDSLGAIKGASKAQKTAIQEILDDCGIAVASCEEVKLEASGDDGEDAIVSALAAQFSPYEVKAEDGSVYRMTIKNADYSVLTITNADGDFVYGGVSSLFG